MSMTTGIIKTLIGQVFALSPDGSRRLLIEGDKIFAGEQIETGANGAVTIGLPDGTTVDLGRGSHWDNPAPLTEAAEPSVAAMQQAIADGLDPTQNLEATAAGPQAVDNASEDAGPGGAHTHVILDLTGEIVDPTAGYPTEGLVFSPLVGEEEITQLSTDTSEITDAANTSSDSTDPTDPVAPETDAKLVISVSPESTNTETKTVGQITHINGGSSDPNGYDVQNGVIVAIGSNVRVWLTSASPDGSIPGDPVPTHSNDAQIKYYSNGNPHSNDYQDSSHYTDIFVIGSTSGYYYHQSDWPITQFTFNGLNSITGDQRLDVSSPNKDFIFLTGESDQYSLNTPTNNNDQGKLINTLESLNITFTNGKSLSGSNGIDNIIYGDGTSHAVANKTPASSVTEDITKSTTTLSVDIEVSLVSTDDAHMLTSIILTAVGGLPDNVVFKGEGLINVSYADGSYTLTFEPGTTDFNGSMTATFPADTASLGDITLIIDSNASELDSNSFTFDSESGLEYDSSALDNELALQPDDVSESDHGAELSMSAAQHIDHYDAEQTEEESLHSTEEIEQSTNHDASETVDNSESPDGQEHLSSEWLEADDNTHNASLTDSETNNGLEHDSVTLLAEHESFDTTTDETNLSHIQLETTSSDTALNLLVDNIGDDHSEWNLSHDENSEASGHINHSDYSALVENGEPLALEDIISDEMHQDSPDHLLPQALPVPVDYADNAGSEPGEVTDNSWVSHDTAQVEDLIAKPEVES